MATTTSGYTSSSSLAGPSLKHRVVSHWKKSTPEEGIQVIFMADEVQRGGTQGVHLITHPPSAERPFQWDMSLRLAHPPATLESSTGPLAESGPPHPKSKDDLSAQSLSPSRQDMNSRLPSYPGFAEAVPAVMTPSSMQIPTISISPTLLILTLDRVMQADAEASIGRRAESPIGTSRTRCEAYRTLYIYSPKQRRDICVHPVKRDCWPQSVVFDGLDVLESSSRDYHFQIWLAGSTPRQMDASTCMRLSQCQGLLWAMRKDSTTTNVEIFIKDSTPNIQRSDSSCRFIPSSSNCKHDASIKMRGPGAGWTGEDCGDPRWDKNKRSKKDNATSTNDSCEAMSHSGAVFRAHKCVLETTSFFHRMLNGEFKEAQADENGKYRIEISSDIFDAEIMDYLLDYIYTKEPIADGLEASSSWDPSPPPSGFDHRRDSSQEPQVHHVLSTNVGLNLETIVTETRKGKPSSLASPARLHHQHDHLHHCRHRNHHRYPFPSTGPTLKHWGAFYRAAVVLEDKELQAQMLQQIQLHLDPDSTLDQVLTWGHEHEDVKMVMLQYLVQKRREIFGDEQYNKLRPYFWAEYEEQVETLVEITSQIARQ